MGEVGRRRKDGLRTIRRGISLAPLEEQAVIALAELYEGGNVSRYIGRLVREAWDAERAARTRPTTSEPVPTLQLELEAVPA